MHEVNCNRVVFYSKEDLTGGFELRKGDRILRNPTKASYTDVNDIIELYNIERYINNELYLADWTSDDIANFKQRVKEYRKVIGKFMASVNDSNAIQIYNNTCHEYINSFWKLVNNQKVFTRISKANFSSILLKQPHNISIILTQEKLVDYYDFEIKTFMLTYLQSAEILLSIPDVRLFLL